MFEGLPDSVVPVLQVVRLSPLASLEVKFEQGWEYTAGRAAVARSCNILRTQSVCVLAEADGRAEERASAEAGEYFGRV